MQQGPFLGLSQMRRSFLRHVAHLLLKDGLSVHTTRHSFLRRGASCLGEFTLGGPR